MKQCLLLTIIVYTIHLEYNNHNFVLAGIWTAVPALPAEGTWIHNVIVEHPGVGVFLLMDIVVLIAGTTLTTMQASQVSTNYYLRVQSSERKNNFP